MRSRHRRPPMANRLRLNRVLVDDARSMSETTLRLTMAQALVRHLAAQRVRDAGSGELVPLFGGVFAIFGHGNVAALGEALFAERERLPTYRGHNEQAMAHTAIA